MREMFRATDPLLAGFGRSRVIRAVVFARVVHAIFRFVAPRSRAEAIHEVRRAVFLVEVERGRDGVVPAFVVLSPYSLTDINQIVKRIIVIILILFL